MSKEISLSDLFSAKLGDNFSVGDKLLDIKREANSISNMAKSQVEEDGEFAKVYAETIAKWMDSITKKAEEALEELISSANSVT